MSRATEALNLGPSTCVELAPHSGEIAAELISSSLVAPN
jgi:hypothetical protein